MKLNADVYELLHQPHRAFAANRKLSLGICVFALVLLLVVVLAGLACRDAAMETDFLQKNMAPCLAHPFGTDWMGRDMFMRTLAGLSTSVLVGLLAACVSALIALVMGTAAALGGKRVDAVITWLIDLMMGIPHIVLLILISYALGKGFVFFTGANGIENGIHAGVFGRIFSGGLMMPLNIVVGLVVACTMYGLYTLFRKGDM